MRWDEIIDPRLTAYRRGALRSRRIISPEALKEAFLAEPVRGDITVDWDDSPLLKLKELALGPPLITKEEAYEVFGLEPPAEAGA